ncbi:MAG: HAMP domain-containing histidine kinase [Rubrobacter sp.]|nr:HAMP domain-containing histidine kinase [Rubrobacter sp.]
MLTLRWRLTLWYGGMAAVVLILFAAVLYLDVRTSLVAARRADVTDAAASVSQTLEETGSPDSAIGQIRWQKAQAVIKDADGNVLAATSGAKHPPNNVPSEPIYPEVQQSGRYLATTFRSQALPNVSGEVYSVLPTTELVLRRLSLTEIAGMVVALALMVGLGPVLASQALRPLKSVSTLATELRRGRLGSRVNLPRLKSRRDEIGEVAASFDAMAESLERLVEAERESKTALRRFVADASHELRTPLATILGYLDVLDESGDTDPIVRHQVLKTIREEGGRMARVVEDLLVLARLDAQREMPAESVDLIALAREVTENHPTREVEFAAPELALRVIADREALRRVISNLLANAIKHTPLEKKILISVTHEDGEAVLRVADEGAGISEEDQTHVFERFYQAESSRAGEGSGLGLAIVRETVEAFKGRVEIQSILGKGSTFTVRLPLSGKLPEKVKVPEQN